MATTSRDGEEASDGEEDSQVKDSARLGARLIYEVLRREGREEMDRPLVSLWWSGLAAGLSISLSLVSQAILQTHLPDAPWSPLLISLGYPVGFLMVVLARHQLFTENTITAVLPVAAEFSLKTLALTGRLWTVVLFANVVGALLSALFWSLPPVIAPDVKHAMLEISAKTMADPPLAIFFKGVAAGFLIAAMVWLTPNAEAAHVHVVILMTYLVSVGGFAHIVAGSVEAFMLAVNGQASLLALLPGFFLPALFGNIVGGTFLFAMLSYGQVAKEMD